MISPIATYLYDHWAGSAHALDLVNSLRKPLQRLATLGLLGDEVYKDLHADREVLRVATAARCSSAWDLGGLGTLLRANLDHPAAAETRKRTRGRPA